MNRTEAIKMFLSTGTHADLANMYQPSMECQVNVAQDNGQRVEGDYKGRQWHGWSDGVQTWKSFRIPYKANSEPEYTDVPMSYSLEAHAEGIGMTGWDWVERVSRWVAFDFDAIVGHSDRHQRKLAPEQIEEIKQAVGRIPWVTMRKSTSGKGLHLYVFLGTPEPTQNHSEHASLARAILGKLSAIIGLDLAAKVDACGGNMWVWHRKMLNSKEGLSLIKQGESLSEVPKNWRDHLNVVTRKQPTNLPKFIESDEEAFVRLASQRNRVKLDSKHKELIDYLERVKALWWWDQDHYMMVAHTFDLALAHKELGFVGKFETLAKGSERGVDQNCFAFPERNGAWVVRRHTPGVAEASTWDQDGSGWTRSYLNKEPDLKLVSRLNGGVESPSGGYVFNKSSDAAKALEMLGVDSKLPDWLGDRSAKLKRHKDSRIIFEIEHYNNDKPIEGWLNEKKLWRRMFSSNEQGETCEPDGSYDEVIRHVVTSDKEDAGWHLAVAGNWNSEPLMHLRSALKATGYNPKEIENVIGVSVLKPWTLVNKPFEGDYPGDREWNYRAAKLRYIELPEEETYPHWERILSHCGDSLTDSVKEDKWCRDNGILTGADYLKVWVASLLQQPCEPLPYLFFYGDQDSGKSIFHEALELLFVRGCGRADQALVSEFNGELEGMVLCVIEETDLKGDKKAYNRIKDWVTARQIQIHRKGCTPFTTRNSTHFVQCANDFSACPIFPGDTRITMIHVPKLKEIIPKKKLIESLEREAPHFLSSVLKLELPEPAGRLNVPVIQTSDKDNTQQLNETDLQAFIRENVFEVPGHAIKLDQFTARFHDWLSPERVKVWTKQRISKELPPKFPKGRLYDPATQTTDLYYGNMSFEHREVPENAQRYITLDTRLVLK